MAKMIPGDIHAYNYTESEKTMYDLFAKNLPPTDTVFYSVSYHVPNLHNPNRFYRGEIDFVILRPKLGYICVEVKGGKGIVCQDHEWEIILDTDERYDRIDKHIFEKRIIPNVSNPSDCQKLYQWYRYDKGTDAYLLQSPGYEAEVQSLLDTYHLQHIHSDRRKLKKSPIVQAREGSDRIKEMFKKLTSRSFEGRAGYAVCFPNFKIPSSLSLELSDRNLVIDYFDLTKLAGKVNAIFSIFNPDRSMDEPDFHALKDLINQNRFFGITTAQSIKISQKRLQEVNRIQDQIINLLKKHTRVKIRGGAGTGKSWLAMKKAVQCAVQGKNTLLTCFNVNLANFMDTKCLELIDLEDLLPHEKEAAKLRIHVKTFSKLIWGLMGKKVYELYKEEDRFDLPQIDTMIKPFLKGEYHFDAIIIDEAQDFSIEWQDVIENLLRSKEKSILYVFYDPYQNIFNKTFKGFLIAEPEYILTENIRNTKEIYSYAIHIANPSFVSMIDAEIFKEEILAEIKHEQDRAFLLQSYDTITLQDMEMVQWKTGLTQVQKEKILNLLDQVGYKPIEASSIDGVAPNEAVVSSAMEGVKELNKILNRLIRENGVAISQILVLSNRRLEKSLIKEHLHLLNFPITDKKEAETDSKHLLFRTIQGFKGLESDIVIYLEHIAHEEAKRELDLNPYQRYVAYTRAKYVLEIIRHEE